MAKSEITTGEIVISRVKNGVIVGTRASPQMADFVCNMLAYEDREQFKTFIDDWWETTDPKRHPDFG